MAKSTMTRWFPAEVKPARRGVYQRRLAGDAKVFSKWTGAWWCLVHPTADGAARMRSTSRYQGGQWRGLASPSLSGKTDEETR